MSLSGRDVGERVLDGGAFAECRPAGRGLLELAVGALSSFIGGDGDGATVSGRRHRALGPQWARTTRFRIELDGGARLEWFHLSVGTRDGVGTEVDLEVSLGEEARSMCALPPWLGEDGATRRDDFIDDGAVDVRAVDVKVP